MALLTNVEPELTRRVTGMQTEAGNRGLVLVVTTGWRSLDDQWRLYRAYKANPKKNPIAAYPGTSRHGTTPATAVDLACSSPTIKNKTVHGELAKKWGLKRTVPSEYWHLELDPKRGSMPSGIPTEEEDMPQPFSLMAPSGRGRWTLYPDGKVETTNFDEKQSIPFHGSMFDYPKEQSKPGRIFTNLQMNPTPGRLPTDEDGYTVFSSDKGAFMLRRKQ